MAIICSEYGGQPNTVICSFVCDTVDEVNELPTTKKKGTGSFADFDHYANIGSTATVNSDSGVLVYMLFSEGWKQL